MSNAKIILLALIALFAMCFYSCASIKSPQGGPRDSLPPQIKMITPLPYTTNFEGKKVTIDFNEYVQLKDQQKLFFVSPELVKKPQLTIKGRSVVVDFQDTLVDNQTYRLDFGASIVDNNEGNKMDGFTYTFSTGPTIDSLVMAGQVLFAQTRDTVIGAFVPFYDVLRDSTYDERGLDSTLFKTRAEALFRADSSGYFIADILKERPYRIYAIADKNGNQRYETGTDMVAFIDSTFNPVEMPPFMFGYDSTKRRVVIDTVQFTLEVFPETLIKRQMLMSQNRPQRSQLQLLFSAPGATIESISLDSIPSDWLIEDKGYFGDTINYWIAPPTVEQYEALGDTIKGRLIYLKQDSTMTYQPDTMKLEFSHIDPKKKEEQAKLKKEQEQAAREAERLERERIAKERAAKNKKKRQGDTDSTAVDSTPPVEENKAPKKGKDEEEPPADSIAKPTNPFGIQVKASSELNPENNIVLTFDYPIVELDSAQIELTEIVAEQVKGARRNSAAQTKEIKTVVPIRVLRDNLRQVTLTSDWKSGGKYELVIPAGVFKNSIHQSNDTLTSNFTILDPDKFGTLTLKTDIQIKNKKASTAEAAATAAPTAAATDSITVATDSTKKIAVGAVDSTKTMLPTNGVQPPLDSAAIAAVQEVVQTAIVEEVPTIDSTLYIFELVTITPATSSGSGEQKIVGVRRGVRIGDTVKFRFLQPGDYFLRITKDDDGNGEWTTGDLRLRRHPERVRFLTENEKRLPLKSKEGWDVEEIVDINKVMRTK